MLPPDLLGYRNLYGTFAVAATDNIVRNEYALKGAWEPGLVTFLRERCFPAGVGTYVDAGANIGLTAVPVALRHPAVVCHAFEPHPANFELLRLNVQTNACVNLHAHEKALSDVGDQGVLLVDPFRPEDHRMLRGRSASPGREQEDQRAQIPVEAQRLDSFLGPDIQRPFVLKMDVQGHELAVLRGCGAVQPDVIVFEFWPYGLVREDVTQQEFLAAFAEYTHGTLLLDGTEVLVEGALPVLLRLFPWDERFGTAVSLIAARTFIP